MNKKMHTEKATELFMSKGFCCSEAVVSVLIEALNLNDRDNTLLNASSALCGGMGGGETCGAIAGAAIVIGMKYGKTPDKISTKLAGDVIAKLTDQHKTVSCKKLIEQYEKGAPEQKAYCCKLVNDSVAAVLEVIEKEA